MLKKFLTFFVTLFVLGSSFVVSARAEGEFTTDASVAYKVDAGGHTQVTNTFTIENMLTELYATSYTLNLENINPINLQASQGQKPLALTSKKTGDTTNLTVSLDTPVVGKGKSQTFNISYGDDTLTTRTGEVWEITIPRLSEQNSFRNYSLTLSVPASFGQEAYISPRPQSRATSDGQIVYFFNKDDVAKAGITAGFGQFQVFSFTLNYHLENPLPKAASLDVAIHPDTAMQKMYYQVINPAPYSVQTDEDGNWLATFLLSPRQRVNVEVKGSVQIFAGPRPYPLPSQQVLADNLKPTQYWQSGDPEIKNLANKLGSPKAIYDFVTTNLSYDYQRVVPNVTRLGAKGALASPKNAICMEYTDLFIALIRSLGIPGREINGYAYTENPKVQPLSLVADVLHSWPEYWDKDKKVWIAVDPTWGSTSGVDFFNKLDLRHFTFVIHGENDQKPYPPGSYKLGPNPQKDVFVSFGQLPEIRTSELSVDYITQTSLPFMLPFMPQKLLVRIKNSGPVAEYDINPTVSFDSKIKGQYSVEILPPYGTYEFPLTIPFSFLGKDLPENILVLANNARLSIPTYKNQVIIYSLIGLFALFSVMILLVLIRLKKFQPGKLFAKIWTRLPLNKP